jgi:Na+/H+-dicarboxylate symporter
MKLIADCFRRSILAKLAVAMAVGAVVGAYSPPCVIRVLNSLGGTFSQLVKFMVPLIVLALVTPAIADAKRGAGKMLLAVVCIAYASTLLSGAFAFGVASSVFPRFLDGVLGASAAAKKFPAYFVLQIPPMMSVTSAMVGAFVIGLSMSSTKCDALSRGFAELKELVTRAIGRAIVPFLPLYILTVVADLAASGSLAAVGGSCLPIIATVLATTIMVLLLQYAAAGIVARKNPLKALWTMLPAYFTGLGCCSSAATIPVTLRQVRENGVSDETANLVVPLCANIHLAGSIAKIVVFSAGFIVLAGRGLEAGAFAEYVLLLSVLAVAAPGVPGGMVIAAAPIAESVLGIPPEHYAMLMAAYLSIDGVGTACNLTGDGAIAIVVDRFRASESD